MKIVDPAVEAVQISDPLKKVEYIARGCTDSYRKMTAVSARPFCEKLLKMGHTSPFEHFRGKKDNYFCVMRGTYGVFDRITKRGDHLCVNGRDFLACADKDLDSFAALEEADDYITLKFTIDIGIARELTRHRQLSFMERSTRYVNLQGGIEFVRPRPFKWANGMQDPEMTPKEVDVFRYWRQSCMEAENAYCRMLELGASPQEARSVLPLSTKTVLFVTGMFSQWAEVFSLRLASGAHPSMRYIMEKAKKLVEKATEGEKK